jgi:hypothetical protein
MFFPFPMGGGRAEQRKGNTRSSAAGRDIWPERSGPLLDAGGSSSADNCIVGLSFMGGAAVFRRRVIALGVLFFVIAVASATAFGATFTTLDDPLGSNGTAATDIYGNNIVGDYQLPPNIQMGFLFDGSSYTTLQYPGAYRCSAAGIFGDNIVGVYQYGTGGSHGFLYNGSSYTTLDDPLSVSVTCAIGISGNNIVGYYDNPSGTYHGFLYNGSSYTTLDDPFATLGTFARGISGNKIVGFYDVGPSWFQSVNHGFLFDGSSYTTLDDPLGVNGTIADGIYGSTVVGCYQDSSGKNHGFIFDGSSYTTLDDPLGTNGTEILGIWGNSVVGSYLDSSGNVHGFVAIIPEPSTLVLLGIGAISLLAYAWRRRKALSILIPTILATTVILAASSAQADVFNMGGTRDPTTGIWTGSASLEFVTVGNPGNAVDTATGYGSVPYVYQMGKYDVTVGQYTAFLNAVATTDTYGLYNTKNVF